MSDELSRRRLGAVPDQPSGHSAPSGWQHHGSADEPPLDMNAVVADDEFIEALVRGMPVNTHNDAEYQLAALLAGWRHEALSEPAPEFPSVDDVERAIIASQPRPARKAIRHLRLASGAAAVVVVAVAGLTVLSQGASPGDPLWGVKQVVFAEQASQTQAATDAQQNLERAEAAMARGETEQAQALVDKAAQNLAPVRDQATRKQMDDWINRLRASVPKTTVSTTTTAKSAKPSVPWTSNPASIPPDLRSQARTAVPTPTPTDETTLPSSAAVPEAPSSSDEATTPSTPKPTPRPRPSTRPGGGPVPPVSILPN